MDYELLYTGEMSHSGVEHDDEEVRRQNAGNYLKRHKRKQKELDDDPMKISLMSNLEEEEELEDSTRLDVAVSNNEICEEESSECISAKSCIGDSTRTTRGRTTLRELLRLPADFGSPSEVNQVMPRTEIETIRGFNLVLLGKIM